MLSKNDIVPLKITDMAKTGEGIGRAEGFALFVKDTVPGDTVEAVVTKVKKSYGYARLVRVITPSEYRVEAPCEAAVPCGGCQLQMMSYEKQLEWKRSAVSDALTRIGGIKVTFGTVQGVDADACEVEFTVPSDPVLHSRNKMIVPVGTDRNGMPTAGFYARRTHSIIRCDECLIGPEESGAVVRTVLLWMRLHGISAYDE